jgi:hypothetical protein
MTIGNVPGDAFASAVVDTLTDLVSAGSFGVVSVARTGPTSYRVTLSSPTDADACMCVVEIDGGTPTVINATPVSPTVWDVDWAPVASGGVTSVTGLAPVVATTAGTAVSVSFIAGTAPGQVLEWNGAAWLPTAPSPGGAWSVNTSIGHVNNNPTPTRAGAVYLDAPRALAATCQAYFRGLPTWQGLCTLVDTTGTVQATFDTGPVNTAEGVAFISAPTALLAGWYTVRLASPLATTVEILGLWLTE